MYTKTFKEISKSDVIKAGGKAASLGEMMQVGIPVPSGFVVLANAFEQFLKETNLNTEIDSIFGSVNQKEIHRVEEASEKIKALITQVNIPKDIEQEIKNAFKKLRSPYVAVRSSATTEDSATAAWAGQLETYLNTTEKSLLENIKKCWSSLYTPRAIFYRFENNLEKQKISVAVVVQQMIQSAVSGTAFSVHPVTEDRNQLLIEAVYGLGEAIVSGQITPDSYVVNKQALEILDKNVNEQIKAMVRSKLGNEWTTLSTSIRKKQKLTDKEILVLSKLIRKTEKHFEIPVDVEWVFQNGRFFITQSRPITTLSKDSIFKPSNQYELTFSRECILATVQVWYVAENDKFSKHTGYKLPANGCMFFEYIHGLARNYIDLSVFMDACNFALAKTLQDQTYFEGIETSFWRYFAFIKPYLHGKKHIQTKEEFKIFFDNVAEAWGSQTICYAFTFFENLNVPKEVFQRSEKVRLAIETIIDDCNRIFSEGLQNIFGKKYVNDYTYLTLEEIVSEKIPPKKTLEQRKKYLIYFKRIRYDESLNSFLAKENKYLEKVEHNIKGRLKGQIAYKGKVRGTVKVCFTSKEMDKVEEGDVLVSSMTTPQFLPAIKLSSAIVTDEGGVTCHAAIVAREFSIPCIVGTKVATKALKDGDLVEVDANSGIVKKLS